MGEVYRKTSDSPFCISQEDLKEIKHNASLLTVIRLSSAVPCLATIAIVVGAIFVILGIVALILLTHSSLLFWLGGGALVLGPVLIASGAIALRCRQVYINKIHNLKMCEKKPTSVEQYNAQLGIDSNAWYEFTIPEYTTRFLTVNEKTDFKRALKDDVLRWNYYDNGKPLEVKEDVNEMTELVMQKYVDKDRETEASKFAGHIITPDLCLVLNNRYGLEGSIEYKPQNKKKSFGNKKPMTSIQIQDGNKINEKGKLNFVHNEKELYLELTGQVMGIGYQDVHSDKERMGRKILKKINVTVKIDFLTKEAIISWSSPVKC